MGVVISYSKSVIATQPGNVSLEILECQWNINKKKYRPLQAAETSKDYQ